VSICARAGLPKLRGVPDTERIKDTKTLDYASTPLDANTVLWGIGLTEFFLWILSNVKKCEYDNLVVPYSIKNSCLPR
jgi:hypothetical protein